jgi:hypothetical protein
MPVFALLVWIAAVVVYVALARWRGASWRSIAGLPGYAVGLALVEFGVPPVVARHPGTDLLAVVIAIVAVSLVAGCVLWLILRVTGPATTAEVVSP